MKNSRIYKNISGKIKELVVSDVSRRRVSFFLLNGALTLTALVMSIVNIITAEYALFVAAFTFSLLCLLNIILLHATRVDERLIYTLFGAESLALLAFFFVSGIPNGRAVGMSYPELRPAYIRCPRGGALFRRLLLQCSFSSFGCRSEGRCCFIHTRMNLCFGCRFFTAQSLSYRF